MRSKFCLALAVGFLFAAQCMAQVYYGRITGLVTDQSGAAIPGATVTVANVGTGSQSTIKTNATGVYIAGSLVPGMYTVTVEMTGFSRFTQENVNVQVASDLTVNATLKPGTVHQVVTVTSAPPLLQANTSNQDITLNTVLAENTPRYDRNPFKLTLLAPEAINTRGEILPFLSWSANSIDLGGDTNLKNNLLVDGSPVGMGHKYSYPPNMDDVQETAITQNGVDAQYGHSAGGVINIATKSGTNQWHGDAMYLGRYPWINAIYDRTRHSLLSTRQNMFGGTLGNPIIKDKLFNFASVEIWKVGNPTNYTTTVPTPLQLNGDFSQTQNVDGTLDTIYNPYSTTYDAATNTYSRTPFSGNIVPPGMMDPVTSQIMKQFWPANNPGTNITGVNNFQTAYQDQWTYYNYSDRVDYSVNSRWKVFGRWSAYHTTDIQSNVTPNNSQLYTPTGTFRTAKQIMGEAVWTVNPTTVITMHADYDNVVDAYTSTPMGGNGWGDIWPNNPWYVPAQEASPGFPIYYPDLIIGGNQFGGRGFYWNQRPEGEALSADVAHQMGSHYLKAGVEWRRAGGPVYVSNTSQFYFNTGDTANSPVSPDTLHSGNGFASFLLGTLTDNTEVISGPVPVPIDQYWGMYFQDDWRVNRKITVQLGLRNEYETAWYDAAHTLSKGLDLSAPIPAMQANPPNMPAQATAIVGNNFFKYNGQWQFTTPASPGMWNAPKLALAPRAGIAYRIDNKDVLRAGYARYVIPTEFNFTAAPISGFEDINFLEPPYFGMTGFQSALPLLNGVPQQTFASPFPSNTNPLVPVLGTKFGTNVGRGGENLLWYPQNFQKAWNDRIDVNFQRQIPGHMMVSFTYFLNLGHQHYTKELNAINPALNQQYQSALSQSVPNPFYQYLDTTLMPGPYFNRPTLPLSSLLVPYPQYGPLFTVGNCCNLEHYHQIQLQLSRPFTNGLTFLAGYVYTNASSQINYFNDKTYYNNTFQWQKSNQPTERFVGSASYELPFGQGRPFLHSSSPIVNAIVGGWQISPVLQFIGGDYPSFGAGVQTNYQNSGNMIVTGNPCANVPSGYWFNPGAFQQVPANTYVLRTNPIQFGCLKGPAFWELDASLTKDFKIFERFSGQLKMTAYNATNHLNLGDPDTNIYSSTFGQALFQGAPGGNFGAQAGSEYTSGRQVELGFKLMW
jgi:Carboxypeptidase regulatory-like domain